MIPEITNISSTDLIVMLTLNDFTVGNAAEIFNQCKDSKAKYWGMKEVPLPKEQMKALYAEMNEAGKTTVLEVVGYDEAEGITGAELAAECGCNILMGTVFSPVVAKICRQNDIRYMPFVGKLHGRPSILSGTISEIVEEALKAVEAGADGIDLLGYRYDGDQELLIRALCRELPGRVCVAGSIDSYRRIEEVKDAGASLLTIGGAFFENKFDGTFCQQINNVCTFLEK